jgi:hypothetical protein
MASNHLRLVVNNPPVEPSVETSTKKQKVTPVERQHDRIKELAGSLGHGDHGDDLWTVRAISRACERLENLLLAPIIKERATQCLDCIPNLRDHERTFLLHMSRGSAVARSHGEAGTLARLFVEASDAGGR